MLEAVTLPASDSVLRRPGLNVFVPHASDELTDHLPHGDGLVAFEVASRLAARGHNVYVASPEIAVRGPIPPTLHLFALPTPAGALGRLRYVVEVRRLFRRLQRDVRFDIVHQLNPVFTGMSLALAGTRVPVVLGSYLPDWPDEADSRQALGTIRFRGANRMKNAVALVQQRCARRLLLTTRAAEHRIVEPRRHAAKIVEFPHGIDPLPYASEATEPATPTIVFLGGLEKRKGVLTLVEAHALLLRAGFSCRLTIGGMGRLVVAVQDRVRALGTTASVKMLYRVDRGDVPALMASASIYCMPSDGEPFGMSLLEAMAAGKPVVVGERGGPAYIVESDGGLHVPANDPVALAAALAKLLRDPNLRRSMGDANRRRVRSSYAWDTIIPRLEREYYAIAPVASGRR